MEGDLVDPECLPIVGHQTDQRLADGSRSHNVHDSGHSELRLPMSVRHSLPER